MKTLLRFLSFMAALWAVLTHIRPKPGPALLFVGWIKVVAGSMTPFLALLNGIYTLSGWRRRDWLVVLAGLVGSIFSLRHIAQVIAPHDAFDRAFGPYWRGDIPLRLRKKLRPRRFTPGSFAPRDHFFQRDIIIGHNTESGSPILADLWTPPPGVEPTGLGIIYLHGSAWHYMDKDMGTRPYFSYLVGQGHTLLDVAYTLAHKTQLPAMIAEVKHAIAWFKNHAHELGVNPERIVLWGGSAGGHLALLAAYTPNDPAWQPPDLGADSSVRGVISYYGLPDLVESQRGMETFLPVSETVKQMMPHLTRAVRLIPPDGEFVDTLDFIPHLLGGSLAESPELYVAGSPTTYVGRHCPPTLLINGALDFGIDVSQHRQLHGALVMAGVAAAHVEFPLTDHGFDLLYPAINPAGQAALYDLERFLALMV